MSRRLVFIFSAGVIAILTGVAAFLVIRSTPAPPAATPAPILETRSPDPAASLEPPAGARPMGPTRRPATRSAPAAPAPVPVEEAPTTGTLVITSDVPDTSVFVDRVYLGTAPVTAVNLSPGQHHLNMSAIGYDAISEAIEVAPGSHDLSIAFKEIRLDAKIEVVHKHAMGSCAGTLRATPQGLTFTPTSGNDAFTVPLTDLETFEVDYLAKNLRVKIRRGRTYNFTDPDGNADRLFVFHRDVDKARRRMTGAPGLGSEAQARPPRPLAGNGQVSRARVAVAARARW
jgi:PEGA domain